MIEFGSFLVKKKLLRMKYLFLVTMVISSVAMGQGTFPTDGIVGQWKFDDPANLAKPTVGAPLVPDVNSTSTPFIFDAVAGPTADDGAVNIGTGSFYRATLNMLPNGSDSAKRVNQYTFVIDFNAPAANVWYAFFDADGDGDPTKTDAELFIKKTGQIGVGKTGYSYDTVKYDQWYRLVVTADLGHSYKYYLDGQLILNTGAQDLDGRFSLAPVDGANKVVFFGDNDGDDAPIKVASLTVYDHPLTSDEVFKLGGFGHVTKYGDPFGSWTFDDPNNLTTAKMGNDLKLVGTGQTPAAGPESADKAVTIEKGSYYEVTHDMVANGGSRVNKYSLIVDFKIPQLGQWYSILQTDPTNSNAADLYVNDKGQIGSDLIGWSKKSINAGEFYKLAVSADLGNAYMLYLDGDTLLASKNHDADNDLSIVPRSGADKFLLFADNAGKDGPITVSSVNLYNRNLSSGEIKSLGGYEHSANTEITGSGKSLYFDATKANRHAVIQKTNNDFEFGDGDFTIEAWVKPSVGIKEDPCLISSKDWHSGTNLGWVVSVEAANWRFNMADANANRYDIKGPFINDGNWHHIAVIVNRTFGVKLLTDSLESDWDNSGEFKGTGSPDNPAVPICIAQDATEQYLKGDNFPGEVDEIRIWKGIAVDPNTVREWEYKPVTSTHPNYSNLVAYWNFENVTDTVFTDASGKGHSGVLRNSPKTKVSYAPLGKDAVISAKEITGIYGGEPASVSGGLTLKGTFPIVSASGLFKANRNINSIDKIMDEFDNPFAVFGHNNMTSVLVDSAKTSYEARLTRVWTVCTTVTPISSSTFDFNIITLGGAANVGAAQNYVLLKSDNIAGPFTVFPGPFNVTTDSANIYISGVELSTGYYTLATKDMKNSPLGGITTDVKSENSTLPKEYTLSNNYPNPFNPSTKINFTLPVQSKVTLEVYNMLGQRVATLVNSTMAAGNHDIIWNACSSNGLTSSGVYIYKINAEGVNGKSFTQSRKMLLLK